MEALGRPGDERAAFIRTQAGGDEELQVLVERLVRSHEEADDFLSVPTGGMSTQFVGDRTADVPPLPGPGTRIGPYKLLQEIGAGGFGVVFMAEQEHPVRRRVALKVIKLGMDTRETIARFEAERQALAMMDHPNIARVLDAGSTETGRPYFVMELVKGVPVTEYCNANQSSPQERLRLFCEICHAVQHAHQKGIIHRDIKPGNVLVTLHDGRPVPKVIDFGIAKAIDQRLTEKTLFTRYGQLVGTPQYMSPEQAELSGLDIDTRSDVYSLGVLLYELLTGSTPFDVESLREASFEELQRIIREEDPPKPSTRLSALGDELQTVARQRHCDARSLQRLVRGELDWIVMKALERDRTRRYDTANALAADIARYLADEPVLANPPTLGYRLSKALRRNRGLVTAVSLVLVGLTVGLVWALFEKGRADETALLAEERYDEIIRLADLHRVAEYRETAQSLWPADPDRIPDLQEWLSQAEPLAARLAKHESTLARLRSTGSRDADGRWRFAEAETQWQHDNLASLVEELHTFADPDPHVGALTSVQERLRFASSIAERSVSDPHAAKAWAAAIADIEKLPVYGGLKLTPQVGLLPLERDPGSGLWEFTYLQTGDPPAMNPHSKEHNPWQISEDTGIVLVLVPGGCFQMGAQKDHAEQPNFDLHAAGGYRSEAPVHEITLDPFFISKYEMTQAQWARITGSNPSRHPPGYTHRNSQPPVEPSNPVEHMSWDECRTVLDRLGLELPTEAQWEYAARGGTTTAWWCGSWGSTIDSQQAGNLADATYEDSSIVVGLPPGAVPPRTEKWRDGWSVHAPVGSFAPNGYGLHDVIGNVSEWCRDVFVPYQIQAKPGDGVRKITSQSPVAVRVFRGGSFSGMAGSARSASRASGPHQGSFGDRGVRPARRLVP